ncbi:MAG: cyclohexanecarboxylate-CoA ligase [Gammaproteobacteria bacterium]|nr:MAG: cyclohexanecarboxylate-CoA ligase [Gammaproteobacteria bacterium]
MDILLTPERLESNRSAGYWTDRLLTDYLDDTVARVPDRVAIVDNNSERGSRLQLTYGELSEQVDRIALGLDRLGVGVADVVAFQLPNWWQFVAIHLACVRLGAVGNPLMPIFRQREMGFMLKFAEAKVVIVPEQFRGFDCPAMIQSISADLSDMQHLLVIGSDGNGSFEQQLLQPGGDAQALYKARGQDANRVMQLLYTSGTTGQPKGVMQTSNTLIYGTREYMNGLQFGSEEICLMASPMAHQTGFMYGMMLAIMLGRPLVLQDIWDADRAWQIIREEKVTFTMGATPFLSDLAGSPQRELCHDGTFRTFVCGGAPIPEVLLEQVNSLGINAYAGWGMTECGVITLSKPGDSEAKILGSDGSALPGAAVKVVDESGATQPAGVEGDLLVSGGANFVGYLKRPEAYGHDADGWFDTGDRAVMDGDGYIRIAGRTKDIIIRGGENIPVAEVEGLLYRHPAIADAAVVAMPDSRLGERGCAFVTLKPGQNFDFKAMQAYFDAEQMARQYIPERLEILELMPRTATGKIQKFQLREQAQSLRPDSSLTES